MKFLAVLFVGLIGLTSTPLWAQMEASVPIQPSPAALVPAEEVERTASDRMLPPPTVSGQSYPIAVSSEERSNYLRGGIVFTGAYNDNAPGSTAQHQVNDESYAIAPSVDLQQTTPRMHYLLRYAPSFTFYQRSSSLNENDQNAAIEFEYRLSPHVTMSVHDNFQKSSNVLNQTELSPLGAVSGGTQGSNLYVLAPFADRLSNVGNVGLTYQFSQNGMVGGSGSFTNLHYPDASSVPGLIDSNSQSGTAFYARRFARRQYVGALYQYQRLVSEPTSGNNVAQTNALLMFYTVYPTAKLSLSFFGGPQRSNVEQSATIPSSSSWTPAAGASLGWQGQRTTLAASYSHVVSGGAGLLGAVQMDSANASLFRQFTKGLSGSVAGAYIQNDTLGTKISGETNGHSVVGTGYLQQQFGRHVSLRGGYTWLRQSYSNLATNAASPVANQVFVGLSYQFERAIGR